MDYNMVMSLNSSDKYFERSAEELGNEQLSKYDELIPTPNRTHNAIEKFQEKKIWTDCSTESWKTKLAEQKSDSNDRIEIN